MQEIFWLSMLLGATSGLLAGLFGLGGGVLIVPALVWMFSAQQFPQELIMIMSVATSLATIVPTAISAAVTHHFLGNITWERIFRLMPGILIGAAMGATVADLIDAEVLRLFFISYLLYVGFRMAMPVTIKAGAEQGNHRIDYLAGGGIGFLSSILGIGGGTLTVPYLVGRQVPMKKAVAVSSVCGLPIAISGTITYALLGSIKTTLPDWSLGYVYLPALAGIAICSVVTAPLGAKIAHKLPAKKLKRYFSLVIFIIALKMVLG